MNKKLYKNITISILLLCVIFFLLQNCFNYMHNDNLMQSDYRTDTEPLVNRFGNVIDIQSCYWKTAKISNFNFGPTAYRLKGFIILTETCFDNIKSEYDFEQISLTFEENINPHITGLSNFEWYYNKLLSDKISQNAYIGNWYIDINNGILYFDLESN
ncbi:MAG: hypothetical protein E7389_01455 [Ruminococcaceae bacterium]|nr:hypothetical protein [Oscillospiraceae bacterium]